MQPEAEKTASWRRIEELFHALLAEPAATRTELLYRLTPGDHALRAEVEALLEAHEAGASLFDCSMLTAVLDAPVLAAGDKVGDFEILRLLGRGGMGEVYQARDLRLGREVALKVLATGVSGSERRRFLQEAQAASALNHPNIVTIHDVGADREFSYIAMECVEGKTLDTHIPPQGMAVPAAVEIASQLASALTQAHAAGIVHRDLKPNNVMVTDTGTVKVLDFGLAKRDESAGRLRESGSIAPQTEPGIILGTVGYMSPEQAEGRSVDSRSDIFSFGSILYEMVTGKRAFQRETSLATLAAILRDEPDPMPFGMPADLRRVIERCLAKDRQSRYQSMADVQDALAGLRPGGRSDRLRWRSLLAGAGAVGIVTAASFLAIPHAQRPAPSASSQPELIPFTSSGGRVSGSFSPNGRQVVFSWDGEDHRNVDIYVRELDSPVITRLTRDQGTDESPAVSPDGRQVGFIRTQRNTNRHLFMLIDAKGGNERTIAEVPGTGKFAWLQNGKRVVLEGLKTLSVETGEIRQLTKPLDEDHPDITPSVSPDGHTVAFGRATAAGIREIFLLPLDRDFEPSSSPTRLTSLSEDSYNPAWTPDGRKILFQSAVDWTFSLWRIAVSGTAPPEHLPFGQGDSCGRPEISPDGKRLLYVRSFQDLDMWRLPLASAGVAAGPAIRFASSTRDDSMPRYSRDGRRVAFNSNRRGKTGVWLSDAQGSSLWPVPLQVGRIGAPSWSPDGKRLAYDWKDDVYVTPTEGGELLRLTTAEPSDRNIITEWSRDAKWVYFTRFRLGHPSLWRVPSKGGAAIQIAQSGGAATESPDGRFVYFMKDVFSPAPLCRMPSAGGDEVQVLPRVWRSRGYAVLENGIYFLTGPGPDGRFPIQFLNFANATIKTVATPPLPLCCGIDVSPDGRFLLYVERERSGADLMLVDNFQ